MSAGHEAFLKLRNFHEVRGVLSQFARGADLSWFDEAGTAVCMRWFRLAQQHLRVAEDLVEAPRSWRSAVSRSYYAVYNASKSVRYFVSGFVKSDVEDHKAVGDLPADFPNRNGWENFAVELRRDRNLADYEPWIRIRRTLTYSPAVAVGEASRFLRECRSYLRARGVLA